MPTLGGLAAVLIPGVAVAAPAMPAQLPADPSADLFWWVEVLSAGLWILAVTILVYCVYDCRRPDNLDADLVPDSARSAETGAVSVRAAMPAPSWRARLGLLRWRARTNG